MSGYIYTSCQEAENVIDGSAQWCFDNKHSSTSSTLNEPDGERTDCSRIMWKWQGAGFMRKAKAQISLHIGAAW